MASGAQLNRWGKSGGVVLLTLNPSCAAQAVDGNGIPTAYGTIGGATPNDSGVFVSPIGLSKFGFQMLDGGTGYTVTLYGTYDPLMYQAFTANSGQDGFGASVTVNGVTYLAPKSSWVKIPGPSEQSGTGSIANPMTAAVPLLYTSQPFAAIRAVLTGVAAPSGTVRVVGFAIP